MAKKDVLIGLAIALLLAGGISLFASSWPDGLERVAEDKNFIERAAVMLKSPIPDYAFPGLHNEKVAGSIAGIAGVLIVFGLGLGLSQLLKGK